MPQLYKLKNGGMVDANHPDIQRIGLADGQDAPPGSDPNKVAAPSMGPLGVNPDGTATHQPSAAPAPTGAPAPAPTGGAPTPSSPKPGDGWVPTADGQGWLPPDQASSPNAWHPATPTAPTAPLPVAPEPKVAGPIITDPGLAGGDVAKATGPVSTDPAAAAAPAPDPLRSAFKDALMSQLGGPAASLNDPALKAQADAYHVGQSRSLDAAREAMAERAAADGTGTDSGSFEAGLQGLYQQQGENQGDFNAKLVGNELQQQRDRLMQAAALAGNTLSADDARAMQEKLANLDAQIKREGLAQSGSQFDKSLAQSGNQFGQSLDFEKQKFGTTSGEQSREFDIDSALRRAGLDSQTALGQGDLSLRDKLGTGGLNLNLLQLLSQNDQFGKQLGANIGMFNTGAQNSWLQSLLGAL